MDRARVERALPALLEFGVQASALHAPLFVHYRCRANMAYPRQTALLALDFVKVLKIFKVFPLRSEARPPARAHMSVITTNITIESYE